MLFLLFLSHLQVFADGGAFGLFGDQVPPNGLPIEEFVGFEADDDAKRDDDVADEAVPLPVDVECADL